MIIRFVTILILSFFVQACGAETTISAGSDNSFSHENLAIEKSIFDFSIAVEKKDVNLLNTVMDPEEISLIRLFTSGNLGGRGEPLSQITKSSKINSELAFDIKNQTPFDLPGLFINFLSHLSVIYPRAHC